MKQGVSFLKLNIIIKIQGKAIYSEKFMRGSFFGGGGVQKAWQPSVHMAWHIPVCNENLMRH